MAFATLKVDKKKAPALKSLVQALTKTDKRDSSPSPYVPSKSVNIKEADAGGFIVCAYGPNGENTVVMENLDGLAEVVGGYFKA